MAAFGAAGTMLVGFFLIAFLVNVLPRIVPGIPSTSDASLSALYAVMYLLMLLVVGRLFIALPSTAVETPISFRDAWETTTGNSWRLLGGTALIYAPPYLIWILVNRHLGDWQASGETAIALFWLAVVQCLFFLSAIIWLTYLSLSYRSFVLDRAEH